MLRRAWIVVLGILIGGGFYLLLIDTASLPELYVLAGVALACGLLFLVSREQGFIEARVNPMLFIGIWRLVVRIALDIALVSWEAVAQLVRPRTPRGQFRTVRFGAVEETAEDTGRRAVAEAFGSMAPNTIVVGVDPKRHLLLVHQLRRQGPDEDLDVLRLG
jgi:multisubunit Na+/H+ antiporter MnhE subunit